jgi:glyceraldehyde-3-phosphate dehydrogenase type II
LADVVTDYRVQTALELGIPLYGPTEKTLADMREADLATAATLDDLIAESDIVADCTPKKVASLNRDRYVAAGRKAIFQGGEKHALTGFSFVASLNYADGIGRDLVRVVSCNTTALGRATISRQILPPGRRLPAELDEPARDKELVREPENAQQIPRLASSGSQAMGAQCT